MNKTHFCFLLFYSFLISFSFAQNFQPDSLIQLVNNSSGTKKADALNELSREWVYYDYKNIFKTASEAFEISKKENYIQGEGEALVNMAVFYSISEQGDSANLLFKEGHKIW